MSIRGRWYKLLTWWWLTRGRWCELPVPQLTKIYEGAGL
jgi:hypothetical protein